MFSPFITLLLSVGFFLTAIIFFYIGFAVKKSNDPVVVEHDLPNAYVAPFIAEPALKDAVALMPFSYSHLVEIVNIIDFINISRAKRVVWEVTPDRKLVHDDLQQRALERLNLLELASKQGEI